MPKYKDLTNKVHFLDDANYAHLLPVGCVEITDAEAYDITHPPATVEATRNELQSNRDYALSTLTHDFGDGRVMQVRPQDAGNIQIAIGFGADQEWVMADNTVAIVTSTQLQSAFDAGVQGAMVIWSDYMTALKAL